MSENIRVYGIAKESIVDGPGLRYVIFAQGCPHHCSGCHNPGSHDFDAGYFLSVDSIFDEVKRNPLLHGVTFSGGEPFCQAGKLARLAKRFKALGLDIITYTGYRFEDLFDDPSHLELLEQTDTLVDGKFEEGLKDYRLSFKGSSNQRTIDVQKEFAKALSGLA